MKKIINKEDLKKVNNAEKCRLILAIIKRTSNIRTRYNNILKEHKK